MKNVRIVRVVRCMNCHAMELRTKTTILDDVAQVRSGAVSPLQCINFAMADSHLDANVVWNKTDRYSQMRAQALEW